MGRAHRVPLIIGTNDREGSVFRGRVDILPRSRGAHRRRVRAAPPCGRASACGRRIRGFPARRAAADFSGDYGFWYPSVLTADFHSAYAPVHAYRFDLAPRLLKLLGLDATHGVEMFALFDRLDVPLATGDDLAGRARTVRGGGGADAWVLA